MFQQSEQSLPHSTHQDEMSEQISVLEKLEFPTPRTQGIKIISSEYGITITVYLRIDQSTLRKISCFHLWYYHRRFHQCVSYNNLSCFVQFEVRTVTCSTCLSKFHKIKLCKRCSKF